MSTWRGKGLRQFTVSMNADYAAYLFDMIDQGRALNFSDAFRILIDKDRGVPQPKGIKLTERQVEFLKALGNEERRLEEVCHELGWNSNRARSTAQALDKRGIIEQTSSRTYRTSGLVNIEAYESPNVSTEVCPPSGARIKAPDDPGETAQPNPGGGHPEPARVDGGAVRQRPEDPGQRDLQGDPYC